MTRAPSTCAALARPLYVAALEELDRLAATGALTPPALRAYSLGFYNWSLVDEVPPLKLSHLGAMSRQFSRVPAVAEALRLNGVPILQAS